MYNRCKLIVSYAETYVVKYKQTDSKTHSHNFLNNQTLIIHTNIKTLFLTNNIIITIYSVIITLAFFVTGSSNVVTGETKSFFSVARSVSS